MLHFGQVVFISLARYLVLQLGHVTSIDVDTFEVGNYHPTKNVALGIDEELRIIGMTLDIISPEVSSLTIGDRFLTQSEYQIELSRAKQQLKELEITATQQGNQIITIKNNVIDLQTMTETEIAEIRQEIANLNIGSIENELNQILDLISAINLRLGILESDTGWLNVSFINGVTAPDVQIRAEGKRVFLRGSATLPAATTAVKIANLTSGYASSRNVFKRLELMTNGTDSAAITIRTDNSIWLEFSTAASRKYSFDSVVYLI